MSSRHLALLHGAISPPQNSAASKPKRGRPPKVRVKQYAKTDEQVSKLEEAAQLGAKLLGDKRRKGGVAWTELLKEFDLDCTRQTLRNRAEAILKGKPMKQRAGVATKLPQQVEKLLANWVWENHTSRFHPTEYMLRVKALRIAKGLHGFNGHVPGAKWAKGFCLRWGISSSRPRPVSLDRKAQQENTDMLQEWFKEALKVSDGLW